MGEYIPTNDGRPLKSIDAALDYIFDLGLKLEAARGELASERAAHRLTQKELLETAGLALR